MIHVRRALREAEIKVVQNKSFFKIGGNDGRVSDN